MEQKNRRRKTAVKRKHKDRKNTNRWVWWVSGTLFIGLLLFAWHYRSGIRFYFHLLREQDRKAVRNVKYDIRNIEIMSKHRNKVFGIDVSAYQAHIDWQLVNTINEEFPIDFVFIRATMGMEDKDKKFAENWQKLRNRAVLRGAYHYFRPNENSIKQARNFIRTVRLSPGDLPPVLDIEERSRSQSMDSLKMGLRRWLNEVGTHYRVKPILYSGDRFYSDFLEKEFRDYPLWIANYNFWVEDLKDHWDFWQFSEKGTVAGINGSVDLNIFNGNIEQLEDLVVPFP